METRAEDLLTLKNFPRTDVDSFQRVLSKIAVMIRAELNLRGVATPKIGLRRKLIQQDLEIGVVELIVQIDRPWPNQSWQDFVLKLNQLFRNRLKFPIDVFRMNFKG